MTKLGGFAGGFLVCIIQVLGPWRKDETESARGPSGGYPEEFVISGAPTFQRLRARRL